jgi:hypothetical protein
MMGAVEVQTGAASAEPEQSKATMTTMKGHPRSSNNKSFLIGASIGVLCLAAVLIGVLPDWKKKDNQKTNDAGRTTTVASAQFQSSQGPFNVSIPLFSSDVTKGYEDVEDAKADFGEMAKFLLCCGAPKASLFLIVS